ncbi:hypothetical protein [Paucidesulfovibrio longus]|uniref:hypothetical protein n=1 Tax=Paucidesulfovibrio longus TaxID=889 RepID=UPI0003B660EA|nr:hypothetical protein [Paucidesulfovibrio longus]
MSELKIENVEVNPEFDIWIYSEISKETRMDQDLMDELGERWEKWKSHLNARKLTNAKGNNAYLLLWLDKDVDSEIEGIWQDSPTAGMSFHNLAITMVMIAARHLIPELDQGQCAPLPKPGPAVQDAFESLGLSWNPEGTLDHQFAVFTHMPYKGGCPICFLSDSCPNSQTKQQ